MFPTALLTVMTNQNSKNFFYYKNIKYDTDLDNFASEMDVQQLNRLKQIWKTIIGDPFKEECKIYKNIAPKRSIENIMHDTDDNNVDYKAEFDDDDGFLNSDDEDKILQELSNLESGNLNDCINDVQNNIMDFYTNPLYILSLSNIHSKIY